ncbi:hypothetical protein OCAR_5300 [Afipia carboxidovorans OM5]|uniref:Uncharacterized protein n=1 Tax=Afipia carboxidovorans (strain ATCC 49405 / DSM 1227 / KCTC 32145 / OM5) TaxID=504832 RepID=B6JB91_AFIC5|nr:hypothetical protein OCAR_5300 [Afipia carboxidovorans OM5]AEI03792.1 hypothetical protein OCA4_c26740 [Afipia carboxidovorans OM4]AEI07369.1 hypothetical protein OCA5_c26750 [Afipia carboxidovorans OM5]
MRPSAPLLRALRQEIHSLKIDHDFPNEIVPLFAGHRGMALLNDGLPHGHFIRSEPGD